MTPSLRILVLLPRFPYPLEKGDKLRAFHQLRVLAQRHEVHLCAFNEGPITEEQTKALSGICASVLCIPYNKTNLALNLADGLLHGLPLSVAYFYDRRMAEVVRELKDTIKPDVLYCQLARTAEYVRWLGPIPKVIDFQDAFAKGAERLTRSGPLLMRPVYALEHLRLSKYEQEVFGMFDGHTVISAQDRDLLRIVQKHLVEVVPNGVDMAHYSPSDRPKDVEVLFAGNMGYPPNVRAAEALANEVMPLVRAKLPDARLVLAGARPDRAVKALEGRLTEVTGFVPDLRDQYARAKVFVAPMQIGTGLQNKLLEAMSMAIPCVTTPLANNAIGAVADKEVILAERPADLAEATIKMLTDTALAQRIGTAGMEMVRANYSWEAATRPLEELLVAVAGS